MARVQAPLPPAVAGGQTSTRHDPSKEEPKYTVMMEQITQRKKKLLSKTSFKIQPPKGYTFVSLSEPMLTDKCKEMSRLAGVPIHVVSTSKGGLRSTQLSQQVGRIGHHFSSDIVSKALSALGVDIDATGRLRNQFEKARKSFGTEAARKDQKGTFIGEGITDKTKLKQEQEKLNTEAKAMLTTLFPGMPEKDVKAVIKHAFTIGKDRIGSSAEVSLDRRVHLAVLAHIRHGYTDYDKLLKQVPYQTARSIVEQATLTKMVEWRGEDDQDNEGAVEDILREVIVIPDDEDDESPSPGATDADDGLVFSSEQVPADQIDNRPSTRMGEAYLVDHLPYGYGRRATQQHLVVDPRADQERAAREDQIRRQRYLEARQQLRNNTIQHSTASRPAHPPGERRILVPARDYADRGQEAEPQRLYIQGADGRDRELIPVRSGQMHGIDMRNNESRSDYLDSRADHQVGSRRPPESLAYVRDVPGYQPAPPRRASPPRSHEVIHPSIESPSRPEVIEVNSSPASKPTKAATRARPLPGHHPSYSQEILSGRPQETVLGKRPRDDFHSYLPPSPVKAQRANNYSTPHSLSNPQIVTLSEAPRNASRVQVRQGAESVYHIVNESMGDDRRFAHVTRRPSDHTIVRHVVTQDGTYPEPSHRLRSPAAVQYAPPPCRSPPQPTRSQHSNYRGPGVARHSMQQEPSTTHHDNTARIIDMNSRAYDHNDSRIGKHTDNIVYAEHQGPRTPISAAPAFGTGFVDGMPQSEPQRIVYERVPVTGPPARHVQSYSDLNGRAMEQSRSAMHGLRLNDRHQFSQPTYDEKGRRIVILDAPR